MVLRNVIQALILLSLNIYDITALLSNINYTLILRFLICNNNVIHLTKHCNLTAVSLHRKQAQNN